MNCSESKINIFYAKKFISYWRQCRKRKVSKTDFMFRDIALWLYLNLSLVSLLDFVKNKDGYIVYSLDNIHVNTIIIWMKCPFEAWNFRKMFNWDVFTFSYGMTRFNWSVARLLKRSLREIERSFLICVST